jgi:uncharacterized protein (DUF927 family)
MDLAYGKKKKQLDKLLDVINMMEKNADTDQGTLLELKEKYKKGLKDISLMVLSDE